MAKGGERGLLLPVSADGAKGNGGGGGTAGDTALFKGSAMTRLGAAAALSYMVCSVLLVMFNKAALSSYNFPCANVITLLQMACSTCLLYFLRRLKIISFTNSEPSVPSDSLFFVPFRTLLRTTPLSLAYLLYMGDLRRAIEFPYLYSPGFQAVLLFSCILAFLLNYTIFWNTILNSALTQSMCGNLKDFFTVGIGWVLFGGLPFDLLNVIGQGLGFLGSGFYAYCKIRGK
ncbi:hypothetical protein PR202_ga01978 [Eleusine coracana subsp. coracana]|uniref:Sugar phosphate transporter domain-containing protein n=1 Tax=Eleusine coracana subsp. coracana TaxID=191504 RepID=A0AAV5BK58_ELECO|nr:hypothetical protein PR202_ga01291 [Eleusine coracana subsp. coracana]GJM86149.1 hypothetical protein PR202_ga01978 [Eleusine coracana subsp. coracana]